MEEIAKVVNNNQPGWTNIIETAPHTTLDIGTKLYTIEQFTEARDSLLNACKIAYRKHHLHDDSIGWNELSEVLLDALCNSMGNDEYLKWVDSI